MVHSGAANSILPLHSATTDGNLQTLALPEAFEQTIYLTWRRTPKGRRFSTAIQSTLGPTDIRGSDLRLSNPWECWMSFIEQWMCHENKRYSSILEMDHSPENCLKAHLIATADETADTGNRLTTSRLRPQRFDVASRWAKSPTYKVSYPGRVWLLTRLGQNNFDKISN